MYHHFDRKNQLFIMRYIPSHLHEILFSKLPSGGGIHSKPLSCLHRVTSLCFLTAISKLHDLPTSSTIAKLGLSKYSMLLALMPIGYNFLLPYPICTLFSMSISLNHIFNLSFQTIYSLLSQYLM